MNNSMLIGLALGWLFAEVTRSLLSSIENGMKGSGTVRFVVAVAALVFLALQTPLFQS